MTRVLVLLAAYNGAPWIEEQVDSILAQQGVDVELVVGDDASTDGTVDRLNAKWSVDQRVRVISWAESSGSAGANFIRLMRTVDVSRFDAVALADQDDIWWPDKLRNGTLALQSSGSMGYSAAVTARWDDGREAVLRQCAQVRRADFLFEGAGQGCSFVLDRVFFHRVQNFLNENLSLDPMHFHDWLIYILCRAWGGRWVFDQQPYMTYRQHANNDIGARDGQRGFLRRFRMIQNGWFSVQISKAAGVYVAAGGTDSVALKLIYLLQHRQTRNRISSIALAFRLLYAGRRRISDRGVLFGASIFNWI